MRNILIIGATSAIAAATARRFAAAGARFYLVGRHADRLAAIARDLEIRSGQPVASERLDLDLLDSHPALLERAEQALGGIDIALIAHGVLPDQNACQESVAATLAAHGLTLDHAVLDDPRRRLLATRRHLGSVAERTLTRLDEVLDDLEGTLAAR